MFFCWQLLLNWQLTTLWDVICRHPWVTTTTSVPMRWRVPTGRDRPFKRMVTSTWKSPGSEGWTTGKEHREKPIGKGFFWGKWWFVFGENKLLNVSTITFKHSLTGPMCFFVFIVFPRRESPSWPCLWGQNFASHRGTQDGEATFLTELGKSGDFLSKEGSKFRGEIWDFFSGVFQGITF